ncbi:glycoside hydrolase family 3 N-terminal domain-containing protein [Mesorhizobium sp. BAC0120]|uniref:glycoside hydrolase family 3 N-terminal domain-containing protein n=1 Tax=Mesorhizobium sp. BAC0120 TaxID=3090670 RepID=UPI00298C971A|nr:glycoside hydrolase family 3 N-terminal domain-containing protein [Mesorhizobium sp. BAC0120]MDW6024856.1 glycoside hydrolase family 3 N-terminal domain-containing protein [Mesorhizobium sp. BAC0120]
MPAVWAGGWSDDPAIEARVERLLKQMTLEEKLGQLSQYSGNMQTGPDTGRRDYKEMVAAGEIGSFLNVTGEQANRYQKIAVERSRLQIPLIFGLDVIHGYRTTFPIPLALSSTWDTELVERAARIAAMEASADGVRWTFSPMVDIARDPRWGRISEGAGEDPYLGSAMARAYVRGYQGESLSDPTSLLACLKHYVGYGAAEGGRDYNTTEIPERLLRDVYLPPFQAGVEQGAATVMSAFNALNGVPASANPFTLGQILRKEWQFRGFVVSDWTAIAETVAHGTAIDGADAARRSIVAGVDMDMQSDLYRTALADEITAGKVPVSIVDEAVRRVVRVKFAMGLFEDPYARIAPEKMLTPDHRQSAREAAEKSFVLLKNDGILPLKRGARVALIGPLADSAGNMLGGWSAKGEEADVVTLRSVLAKELGADVTYAKGTEISGGADGGFAEAIEAARSADVVILALGEDAPTMTGEAASRTELDLPGNQEQLLEAVAAVGKPVVLLLFSGRPLVLTRAVERAAAVLEAWFPGVEAGPALVRTLYGDSNPSGKLTASFPRSVGQLPVYYNHLSTGRPLPGEFDPNSIGSASKYTSRYIDQANSPLFPFGFGLSYTTFSYGPVKLEALSYSAAELDMGKAEVKISAEVTNSGLRPGQEVVQLYISQRGTSVARPVRELKGFRRVALQPGETKAVEFALGRDELAFWNIDMQDVVEPGKLKVWIAGSSKDGIPAELTIE